MTPVINPKLEHSPYFGEKLIIPKPRLLLPLKTRHTEVAPVQWTVFWFASYVPARVTSCSALYAIQSWFGPEAVKFRSTRSGGGPGIVVTSGGGGAAMPAAGTHEARAAHQPRDPFAAVPLASLAQIGMHAGRAIGLAGAGVHST